MFQSWFQHSITRLYPCLRLWLASLESHTTLTPRHMYPCTAHHTFVTGQFGIPHHTYITPYVSLYCTLHICDCPVWNPTLHLHHAVYILVLQIQHLWLANLKKSAGGEGWPNILPNPHKSRKSHHHRLQCWGFLSFCLGCYRKRATSLDCEDYLFFRSLLILSKRFLKNSITHVMQQNFMHQLKKRKERLWHGLCTLRHRSSLYSLFLNTAIFTVLKFTLVVRKINSEYNGVYNV